MPIAMPSGVMVRAVTFWYPSNHLGIDDWTVPLSTYFNDEVRPDRRLLAAVAQPRPERLLLAAPLSGPRIRCAGGHLSLLDLAGTGAVAAAQARSRHHRWTQMGTVGARRPGRAEVALLRAGEQSYVAYHRLRRVVGDVLVVMHDGRRVRQPDGCSPDALLAFVQEAIGRLAQADPDDVIVTVAV
ncbi:hypothetical protein [Phytohabitans houttuyneae]|uniref:Uncharacterized protein n=1 Tax=Phytohabitans houttuyneae TaxID=1076126 RepID=A0A6V8K6R9_9ACTN|nr:hypothetical protein [Phytohabitans houttuyneae]GFJ77447.1 hypothetical protein Phou_016270 [Phytohabitans houttuyneae]